MNFFWSVVASIIEVMAKMGAGAASSGVGYEPVVPTILRKIAKKG